MSSHLRRHLAPISEAGWRAIEEEATRTLRHFMAGRPLVDFDGPHGWRHAAVATGRADTVESQAEGGLEIAVRRVLPLIELRVPFELPRAELDAIDRGAQAVDLSAVADAARRVANAEDRLVFQGLAPAGMRGMAEASPHDHVTITESYDEYPRHVARAVAALRRAGIGGPYAIALGPRCYTGVVETTQHGGYPVLEHIRLILGGPVLWAPAVDGAVVVSQRGGDYRLTCGQDVSVGFLGDTPTGVRLCLEESVAFEVLTPEAAVALVYPEADAKRGRLRR